MRAKWTRQSSPHVPRWPARLLRVVKKTDRLLLHFRVGPSMERPLSCWTVSAEILTGRSIEGLASGSAEVLAGCMAHLLAELLLRELALPLVILQQNKKSIVLR